MQKTEKVLIIKAGYSEFLEEERDSRTVSLGDVLRITPLLHLYKDKHVTWITDEKAFPLLEGNPYIDRLLRLDWLTFHQLQKERFDTLINLEKVPGICAFADDIYTVRRYGFRFDSESRKAKAYESAMEVLAVSSDIESKKSNNKTVQELLFEMVGAKWNGEEYVLGYKPQTKEEYDICLNTLVGKKWPIKAWPTHYWDALERLLKKQGFSVTRQDTYNQEILTDLNAYMDWINSCRLVVSNDSLGLHLAIALKKITLGLFGPTTHKEIHFYGRGQAILPEKNLSCLPCLSQTCQEGESCLNHINPEQVYNKIKSLININVYN